MSGGGAAVELSGGTGGITDEGGEGIYNLSYVLRFTALKAGTTQLKISDCEIIGYTSGADIGIINTAVNINISPKTAGGDSESGFDTDDGVIPVDISGETYYIIKDFSGCTTPEGYSVSTVSYNGQDITEPIANKRVSRFYALWIKRALTGFTCIRTARFTLTWF